MNIAILSPSNNAYSETFILAHKKLEGNIFFFHEGEIPKKVEGHSINLFLLFVYRLYFKIVDLVSAKSHNYDRFILKKNLKYHNIHVGLAEYGVTGAQIYEIFKELNIPLIVHFHGYDASTNSIINKFGSAYAGMFEYVKNIVVVSEEMKKDILKIQAPENKIVINPYGPSNDFFSVPITLKENFNFLSVGRFVEKKAPQITIKAFSQCLSSFPTAKLFMIGEGPLLNDCKLLVEELNISDKVKFLGKKPKEEIILLMQKSFAFLLHSVNAKNGDKEGTPVSILEAMAAGLPVVSTYHAGIRDVVLNKITGYLVDENNYEQMSFYMIDLMKNPKNAVRFGKLGRERIQNNFSLKRHLNLLNLLISEAVK